MKLQVLSHHHRGPPGRSLCVGVRGHAAAGKQRQDHSPRRGMDQGHLFGVLDRVRDFGLELISVEEVAA